jgi:hypothetical protein
VVTSATVTFQAGEIEAFFPVGTLADGEGEAVESFSALLFSPSGAGLGEVAISTIFINDRKSFSPRTWNQNKIKSMKQTAKIAAQHTVEWARVTLCFASWLSICKFEKALIKIKCRNYHCCNQCITHSVIRFQLCT